MLKIDIRVGERLIIGDAIISLERKSGQLARIAIRADPSLLVRRMGAREAEPDTPTQEGVASA